MVRLPYNVISFQIEEKMPDDATVTALGRELYEAERARRPRPPLSDEHDGLDVAAAYAIQEAYADLRLADGARLVGRKIGATSKAIQDLFDIDTPDFGQIFDDMVVPDGGAVPTDELIAPRVEPEVAFVLDRPLSGPGVGADDVLAATREVLPCLEIIDSRIADWRIRFVDTVADNGSSARCVFGSTSRPVGDLDLAAERVTLLRDGEKIDTATGEAVLGHPAASVAWLANALGELGRGLRAGEYVLSGSMTTASSASAGERYEAVFETLGQVSCRFA